MIEEAAAGAEDARRSIQDRVRGLGGSLGRASPATMVVVLAGAALWPIVAPLTGAGTAAAMVSGVMGLLGGPGTEFISDFLKRLASRARPVDPLDPSQVRADLERELHERLQTGGEAAAALRSDLSRLLRSVGGVETALAAASGEVRDALTRGLAESSEMWSEFRWMLDDLQGRLHDIQYRQAEGLALQRETLDLQRAQLVKTTLLLQLHTEPPHGAPDDLVLDETPPAAVACPYKGLRTFEVEDADLFFGRERLVAQVLARLAEANFIAVIGASGSGKSSFVRAGVVAAVWRGALPPGGRARVITLTPGEHPLEQLAMRIALLRGVAPGSVLQDLQRDSRGLDLTVRQALIDEPADARLVLVVDQFEELFTLCRSAPERQLFVDALLHAQGRRGSPTIVVLAVRGDFYGRLAAFPNLAGIVEHQQALVGPMTSDDLRRAIERPAAAAGLALEPGLVDMMLEDLGEEPGALPLLSHALLETWKRRRGSRLTIAGYRESGAVRGAIAQTAEDVLARLDPEQQMIARAVFVSLAEIGDSSEPTRRPVDRSELIADSSRGAKIAGVVDILADARLLTVGEQTVEVAHEALIRYWPTLRGWLEENVERLRARRRLTEAAREWENLGRDPGALYRGARLAATRAWQHDQLSDFGVREREFLHASELAEQNELEFARRRTRRLRVLSRGLALLVLLAVGSAALALSYAVRAKTEQRQAESERLATQALAQAGHDIDVAGLLSLEAYRISPTIEARDAALTMIPRLERAAGALSTKSDTVYGVAFSSDAKTVASGEIDGTIRLWNVPTHHQLSRALTGHRSAVYSVAFSPDGKTLASASADKTVRLWSVATHRQIGGPLTGHGDAVRSVAFSPNGKVLASTGDDGAVRLWDVATGRKVGRPLIGHRRAVVSVAFSPDGTTLASGSEDKTVRLWNVADHRQLGRPLTGHTGPVHSVAFSPDGTTLASASADETVRLWSVADHLQLGRALTGHRGPVRSVAFSPDGETLGSGGDDKTVRLWNVRTHRQRGRPLIGHNGAIFSVAFSPDATTLVSAGSATETLASPGGNKIRLWDATSDRQLDRPLIGDTRSVQSIAFSPDGNTLAVARDTVRLWNVMNRREEGQPRPRPTNFPPFVVAFSPDGKWLASAGDDGVRLWNVTTRRQRGEAITGRGTVSSVAFSPDGMTLASAGHGVWLWNVTTHRQRGRPLIGHRGAVWSVAFSPDGKTLASGGEDGVRLWNTITHRQRGGLLTGHRGSVRCVAFSPDGKILASGGDDNAVRLWDVADHHQLGQPLAGHKNAIDSVAFSPDGKTLASADGDIVTGASEVRLWDVATHHELGRPLITAGGSADTLATLPSVAFSPRLGTLAVASVGGVRLWNPILWSNRLSALERYICSGVRENLNPVEWTEFVPAEQYHKTCAQA